MRVYHRTFAGPAILRGGFHDSPWRPSPAADYSYGVFVSADHPLDENEGADGDAVIELTIPDDLFVAYELVEEGKPYREALIPSVELNAYISTARVLDDDESPPDDRFHF